MYPVDIPRMIRRSTLGMNADDPTIPYTPSRVARIRSAIASRGERRHEKPADVVVITPILGGEPRATDRRCA